MRGRRVVWAGAMLAVWLAGTAWAADPARPPLPAEVQAQEAARFQALGAEYRAGGFEEFPEGLTPFASWRRIRTERLAGREVYVLQNKIRLWKHLYCGHGNIIYLELSVLDKDGRLTPFAWQACQMDCATGGACGLDNPLYVDLSGDGRPEARFERLERITEVNRSWLRQPRCNFTVDILPAWLKRDLGPSLRNLSTIGPGDSVPPWQDHPLAVTPEGKN